MEKKYDGSIASLLDESWRPHHYPNEHTIDEIEMIKRYKKNNKKTGLVVLWVKLREAGYSRTVQGLYHAMVRLGIYEKAASKNKRIVDIMSKWHIQEKKYKWMLSMFLKND